MFPIALDLSRLPVLLAGRGPLLVKRLRQLDDDKAQCVTVFSDDASIEQAVGNRLVFRLPQPEDIVRYPLVLVAGLEPLLAEQLAAQVRAQGKLVNVEDVNALCDFYFTANVRRGDLLIAVSTAGASPTLARKVRDAIGVLFGSEWAERTDILAKQRQLWKAEGKTMKQVAVETEQYLDAKAWLPMVEKP